MNKKNDCMNNQIALSTYLEELDKKKAKQYQKTSKYVTAIPFHYTVFRMAYKKLKEKGMVIRSDILEQKVPVQYEVYEALYLKTLRSIYLYCRRAVAEDDTLTELLPSMYEREYEWMAQRMVKQRSDTA